MLPKIVSRLCVPALFTYGVVSVAFAGCSLEEFGNGKRPSDVGDASTDAGHFGAPQVFASNQTDLREIVVGESDVVWIAENNIRTCSKTGTCVAHTALSSDDLTGYLRAVGSEVFYSTGPASGQGAVRRCDLPDCSSNVALQFNLGKVGDLVSEASDTFFLHGENRTVVLCPSHGDCTPKTIAAKVPVGGRIALNALYVFWTAPPPDNAIYRALRSGGNASDNPLAPFATGQANAVSIAVGTDTVFWATLDDGNVRSCPIAGCNGAPHDVATGQSGPRALTIDNGWLYWANSGANTIVRCAIANCVTPEIVAKDVQTPVSMAIDATAIYVAASGSNANAIVRIAKQ